MLDALARGLRAAGGVLSPGVYQDNQAADREQAVMEERRRTVAAAQIIKGVESGAINPEQGQAALKGLGLEVPVGPSPEAQSRQLELQTAEEIRRLAPSFRKGDGSFDRDALLNFVASRDPMKAAQYGKILGVSDPKRYVVGQSLVNDQGQAIYTAPDKPTTTQMSPLGKLIRERDALPEGHPMRAAYDRAIANEQSGSKGIKVEVNNNPNPLPLGKPEQTKVGEALLDNTAVLQGLTQIESQFKPEFQQIGTRAGMAWNSIKEKAGADLDPAEKQKLTEFSAYKRGAIDNLNKYIKAITGAAMSYQEAERILRGMPNPGQGLFDGDSPTEFKAKMDDAVKATRMAVARLEYMKRSGMKLTRDDGEFTIPLDRMPALMNRRAGEIEQEIRSLSPAMPIAEIRQTVRQRLSAEFGLVQ